VRLALRRIESPKGWWLCGVEGAPKDQMAPTSTCHKEARERLSSRARLGQRNSSGHHRKVDESEVFKSAKISLSFSLRFGEYMDWIVQRGAWKSLTAVLLILYYFLSPALPLSCIHQLARARCARVPRLPCSSCCCITHKGAYVSDGREPLGRLPLTNFTRGGRKETVWHVKKKQEKPNASCAEHPR
jgi:hypothetical protein